MRWREPPYSESSYPATPKKGRQQQATVEAVWRTLRDRTKKEERSTGRLGSYVGNCWRPHPAARGLPPTGISICHASFRTCGTCEKNDTGTVPRVLSGRRGRGSV